MGKEPLDTNDNLRKQGRVSLGQKTIGLYACSKELQTARRSKTEKPLVAAVLVLFNPDCTAVEALIEDALPQVSLVVAVDNTPLPNPGATISLNQFGSSVIHLRLGENRGIAYAQNVGIQACQDHGASHILLLDQDSRIPQGMVKILLSAEEELTAQGIKVAAVGPVFIDRKTNEVSTAPRRKVLPTRGVVMRPHLGILTEADYLISSGSLIRIEVLTSVGLMLEELFIDWVDVEWGLRARYHGFLSYVVPKAVMTHSVGGSAISIFGCNFYLHNPIRGYYRIRNAILLLRSPYMGLMWKMGTLVRIPKYVFLFSCFTYPRMRSFLLFIRACIDGVSGTAGKYCKP